MRTTLLILVSIAHLSSKLTGGYSTKYLQYNLREITKNRLAVLQALSSFILAFGITNNYLNEFAFFSERFDSSATTSTLWVIGSAFVLLVVFLIVIGSALTFLTSKWK